MTDRQNIQQARKQSQDFEIKIKTLEQCLRRRREAADIELMRLNELPHAFVFFLRPDW